MWLFWWNLRNYKSILTKNYNKQNKNHVFYWRNPASKGHPIRGHQGPRGGVAVQLYSLSASALGGGRWSVPRPGRFTPGTHCTGGWVGPRAGLDVCEKSRPHRKFDPRTVKPVASHPVSKVVINNIIEQTNKQTNKQTLQIIQVALFHTRIKKILLLKYQNFSR
jgi:hypothetical protein